MPLELSKEERDALVGALRRHAADELEVEMGELKARLLLDFILAEIGPALYERGVADARSWVQDRLEDLEGSVHAGRPTRRA